jgi:hypothetical protein
MQVGATEACPWKYWTSSLPMLVYHHMAGKQEAASAKGPYEPTCHPILCGKNFQRRLLSGCGTLRASLDGSIACCILRITRVRWMWDPCDVAGPTIKPARNTGLVPTPRSPHPTPRSPLLPPCVTVSISPVRKVSFIAPLGCQI